ncbi:MAG TPA: ferric reductase-like transmembrane domain-containing protein [Solirubrobacteraceae bacterium]|nr:ferric reductase-like transmembrane domain-containing protein [Solirubrobacteraceae bacterium]
MSVLAAAGSSPIAFWYLSRGSGVVTLVLLTLTVALGVANFKRLRTRRIPRFVIDGIHRNAALLSVVFLAIHVMSALADSFASVDLTDVFLPFASSYSPLWIGLGALSVDLLLAVLVTSLLRRRIGHRIWRATHWLAYASWPVALAHSLGAGTDAGTGWMTVLLILCLVTVAISVLARLAGRHGGPASPPPPAITPPERRRRAAAALKPITS